MNIVTLGYYVLTAMELQQPGKVVIGEMAGQQEVYCSHSIKVLRYIGNVVTRVRFPV